ncbi:MAG: methyltransferase domain-containing protein [Candidatus Zixiibacteriota bacterium]|nr:MAG: methyltransferase domain-containing protein [candidate division Zixibacteria bacterium]
MTTRSRTRINDDMGTFSERFPVLYDAEGRLKKADKVLAVCRHFSFRPLEELICLDLGASTGIMTERFAESFREVIALDVDSVGLKSGKDNSRLNNIDYIGGDGTVLPLADGSIDVIVCNQIYEHIDNQEALMSEIYRVLKYDGFCFFGAGNRYVIVEGHYFLPFLSWLPHGAADIYMKLAGKKGVYDVRLLSLRKLKRLTRNFWTHDYTGMIFENPHDFCAEDVVRSGNIITGLPHWIYRLIYPMLPAWVWVLTKRK